jgi:predicted nucleic acid-binding protein
VTYLDSVILIYYLDTVGTFQVRAAQRLAQLRAANEQVAVSELSRMECRVRPLQLLDLTTLAKFDGFFALPDIQLVPLTRAVFEHATLIRARHRFKTLDAIHLAAAVESGCSAFLTNDLRLSKFPDITVEVLP